MVTFSAPHMWCTKQNIHAAYVLFWNAPQEVMLLTMSGLTPVSLPLCLQSVVPEKPKRWIQVLNSVVCDSDTLAPRR